MGRPFEPSQLDEEGESAAAGPLDLCIIGGGVAGVTAAVLAIELGLRVQILEVDRLLGRIDELDLDPPRPPGSGERILTPRSDAGVRAAGAALEQLCTTEGRDEYKRTLLSSGAANSLGFEAISLERREHAGGDGPAEWCVRAHEPGGSQQIRIDARFVLITTGAQGAMTSAAAGAEGSGEVRDLRAFHSIDHRILVLGSSRRSIETVVALARAKHEAGDSSGVFWCPDPRQKSSDSLEGLGDELLAAMLGHRNIFVLPDCEILGRSTTAQGEERFALDSRRPAAPGQEPSVQRLEFEVGCVVELDRRPGSRPSLLADLSPACERSQEGDRIVVDAAGQLSLSGLLLAGDALGPRHIRCRDFEDRATWKPVRRSPALAQTVYEAIRAVEAVCEGPERFDAVTAYARPEVEAANGEALSPRGGDWVLFSVNSDGSIEDSYPIEKEVTEIGRSSEDISNADDAHMAEHQASLVVESGEVFIADTGEGSGVWLRVGSRAGVELADEDQIWLGSQILVAVCEDSKWKLVHYGSDGQICDSYRVHSGGFFVGRHADLSLDPSDAMLSRRHAQFILDRGRLVVYDRGARNGTFVKVRGAVALETGDEFRVSTKRYRLISRGNDDAPDRATPAPPVPSSGGWVRFEEEDPPVEFLVGPGKTILQGFVESGSKLGQPLSWECHTGACGLCVVEVVEGSENLCADDAMAAEQDVLLKTAGGGIRAGRYRLACLARIDGPVCLRRVAAPRHGLEGIGKAP